jgi:hypothetical protein
LSDSNRLDGAKMAERDDQGRFTKGHSGGPGRPPRSKEEKYLKATFAAVTLSDWRAIVKKAVEQAKRGNPSARKWLSDYLLGTPQQKLDVTSDGDKLEVIVRYADPGTDLT